MEIGEKVYFSNEFCLKDSLMLSNELKTFRNTYLTKVKRFVSFDVISLFTNIPLNKTIDIILDKIYNHEVLHTTIKKRTMKKLLRNTCTKTPFSICFSEFTTKPYLANIIMTTFEDEIIHNLQRLQRSV